MSGRHRPESSPEGVQHWRIARWPIAAVVASAIVGLVWLMASAALSKPVSAEAVASHRTPSTTTATTPAQPAATTASTGTLNLTATGPAHLAPGSDPSKLPGAALIADEMNNRLLIIDASGRTLWQYPRPGDLAAGQTFKTPDDAYFTPDGKQIIASEEDDHVIRVIDIATRKTVYTYGTPGVRGSGPNQLNQPESALMLPSGDVVVPDMMNCRLIMIPAGAHAISRQLGRTGACEHNPPQTFDVPNGMFPMANGSYLITEATGSWVDEMDLSGHVAWSVHLPGFTYIYESNEIGPNRYLTVDHASPGKVVTFDRTGTVLWSYAPTGNAALDKPSLALPLPSGDVLVVDSLNHRVIVVDARTKAVVWQYGETKVAGSRPGQLNKPTCLDFLPSSSLLMKNAATMGKIPRV